MEYVVYNGKPRFEYFCCGCGQLRLSYVDLECCGHCGDSKIKKGKINELDKDRLKAEYQDLIDEAALMTESEDEE